MLMKNMGVAGVHDVVPLLASVGAFDGWSWNLEWLWYLVQYA